MPSNPLPISSLTASHFDPKVLAAIPLEVLETVTRAVQKYVASQYVESARLSNDVQANQEKLAGAVDHYKAVAKDEVDPLAGLAKAPSGGWLSHEALGEWNARLTRSLKKENWVEGFVFALQVMLAVHP